MKAICAILLGVLAILSAPFRAAADTTNWPFSVPSQYAVSDSNKIEVADGVAKLKLGVKRLGNGSFDEYTTNDTVRTMLSLGPDASVALARTGSTYSVMGTFVSRVIDGGAGNAWEGIRTKVSNRSLAARSVVEIPPTEPNLAALYHFNGTWADAVSGSNSVPVGSPTFSDEAVFGKQSLSLNGANYVETANPSLVNGSLVTITLWLYLTQRTDYGGLVYYRGAAPVGLVQRSSGKVEMQWSLYTVASANLIPTNTWCFIAGSVAPGLMKVYINGNLEGSYPRGNPIVQTGPFVIGYDTYTSTRKTKGLFDEVCIYNRTLSDAEIKALYQRRAPFGIRVRSGDSPDLTGAFAGPDGTSGTFFTTDSAAMRIPGRYLQYEASMASDRYLSTYLDAIEFTGSAGTFGDDLWWDFRQGTFSQTAYVPARKDTPFVTTAKGPQGIYTNATFTSRVFDGGAPVNWTQLAWDRGVEQSSTAYGLLGLWRMNESWLNAVSGMGYDGVASGVSYSPYAKLGTFSSVFNGSSSYVTLGNFQTNIQSAEFWINADLPSDNVLEFGSSQAWLAISNTAVTVNGWSGTPPAIYVNSGLDPQLLPGWNHVALVFSSRIPAGSVVIGYARGDYFSGRMDELAFYNRALTTAEIAEHYVAARRDAAGRIRLQARADNQYPPQTAFVGFDNTPATYFISAGGASLPASFAGKQFFQYRAYLEGDGNSGPALSSVTLTYSGGQTGDQTVADFLQGDIPSGNTRVHGDEIMMPPLYSSGPINLSPLTSAGLAGLWHLDDAQWTSGSPTVDDSSGNGRSGTPSGNATVSDGGAVGARCGVFSTNGTVIMAAGDRGTLDFSVSLWFRTVSQDRAAMASTYYGPGLGYYALEINSDGTLTQTGQAVFVISDGSATTVVPSRPGRLNDGRWHHLSGIRNGGQAHLYVDGLLAGTVPLATGFGSVGNNVLNLGQRGLSTYFFTGSLDEVIVHDRALGEGEVGDLAAAGYATRFKSEFTGPVIDAGQTVYWEKLSWGSEAPYGRALKADSSVVGLWHFDSVSNNRVADASGNGNAGVVPAGVGINASGRFDGALSLSSGQQVQVPDAPALHVSPFSVEAWVNPADAASVTLADKQSGGVGFRLGTDASARPFLTVNGVSVSDPDILRARKWNLLSGTYDGQRARLYVNGILKGVATVSGSAINTADLMWGAGSGALLDEGVLYNRALKVEEVLDHYRSGVGTLKFQVRTWTSGQPGPFVGPGNSTNAYFSDWDGSVLGDAAPLNQYLQYKAVFASEDARLAPKLDSIMVDFSGYPTDNPWVVPADGYGSPFLGNLLSFNDVMATTNSAAVRYRISGNNGTNWYAWLDGRWTDVTDLQSSSAFWEFSSPRSVINDHIRSFYSDLYQATGGVFKFQAFLKSDSLAQVAIDSVSLAYSPGRITLTSPNGTEVSNNAWVAGIPYDITWTSFGAVNSTNIGIELYTDSGGMFVKTIASGLTNSGLYRTIINNDEGTTYRIRIWDRSDPTIEDWSDGDFSLVYNLHLSQPNGAEYWYAGETNTVMWESPGPAGLGPEVALWMSNDGLNWVEVARAPNTIGTNQFQWVTQTHEPLIPADAGYMAVSTPDVNNPYEAPYFDISDEPFIMAGITVTYPGPSSGVKMGDTINVQWIASQAGPSVKIELFDGLNWSTVATNAPNMPGYNTFPCMISAPNPTEQALIRITSLSDSRVTGTSYPFVMADIKILSPKGGTPAARDKWQMGTTNIISWSAGGAGDFVTIQYATDGSNWTTIVDNYPNSNTVGIGVITNYAPPWVVKGPPSSTAQVRVRSSLRQDLMDTTAYFDISGLQVASPNGGEYWEFAGTNEIRWFFQSAGGSVGIDVSYNGGATTNDYQTLDTSVSMLTGRRTVLPNRLVRPSTLAKVLLRGLETLTNAMPMIDVSDATFTIRGLSVVPLTNALYTMGTTVLDGLQWYSAATEDPSADIYYSKDGVDFSDVVFSNVFNNDAGTSWNHLNWSIPRTLTPSKTSRIKVVAGTYQAVSPPFTVRGIRVTQPAAGEIFDLGRRATVRWVSAGLSSAAYVSNAVSVAGMGGPFVPGGLPGNSYVLNAALQWDVDPELDPTTNAVIQMRVTAPSNDMDVIMYSDPFVLRGAKILSPATGTNWALSTTQTIVFKAAGMGAGVQAAFYYSADGTNFDLSHPVATGVPINDGLSSVSWTIENSPALTREPSTNAVLMMISGAFTNYSQPFRMQGIKLVSPKSTDIWAVSDLTNTIRWVAVDAQPLFSLTYTVHDAPAHSGPIAVNVPGLSYDWPMVMDSVGTNVTLKITDGVSSNESAFFSIVPAPTVKFLSPAAGDFWKVGETNNVIRWVRGGNMTNNFTLAYSPYPYATTNTLKTGSFDEEGGIFSFNWSPIPNALGQVRLIVFNNEETFIQDSLDDFRIAPKFDISPFFGTVHALEPTTINWFTLGSVSGVNFYYSTDPLRGSNSWVLINTEGPYANVSHNQPSSYLWTVPNIRTETVWLRIQDDAYTGTVFDPAKKGPYDDLGMFPVDYYTIVWRIIDALTSNELSEVGVSDSSGWSDSGLSSPVSRDYPYGNWNTIWFKQFFNDRVVLDWSSKPSRTNVVYLTRTEAAPEFHVLANFVYDVPSALFKVSAWIERSSKIIPNPQKCDIYIYDAAGSLLTTLTTTTPQATGVFWMDLPSTLKRESPYFAKVEITYNGQKYVAGVTVQLVLPADQSLQAIGADVKDIKTGIGKIDTTLTDLSNTAVQISRDVASVNTNLISFSSNALGQLRLLTNAVGVIGPTGTNLLDRVESLARDVDQRTARILTRPTTVKLGSTIDLLYRTQPNLSAVRITVSNLTSSSVPVSGLSMRAMAGGIYERDLNTTVWGTGDFLVTCSDESPASDSVVIKVAATDMDDLAMTMASLTGQLDRIELALTNTANVGSSVSNLVTVIDGLTNSLGVVAGLTNIPAQMALMTNSIGQVALLTNLPDQVAAMTNAISKMALLTNMPDQVAAMTNAIGKVALLTNMPAQMDSVTNSMYRLMAITNLTPQMAAVTSAVTQLSYLTNMPAQVAYLTNMVGRLSGLTNMPSQMDGVVAAVNQLGSLTNLGPQVDQLTSAIGEITALTNMAGQLNTMSATMDQLGTLTNLTPKMDAVTASLGEVIALTNLSSRMDNVVAAINQLGSLTNLGPQVDQLTSVIGQIIALTNMSGQLNTMSATMDQLGTLTNLTPKMDAVTASLTEVIALTNLSTQMSGVVAAVNQLGSLTNLGPQVDQLTGAMGQITALTNIASQMDQVVASVNQFGSLTNLGPQVDQLNSVIGQITALTNVASQMDQVVAAVNQFGSLTNLGPQVDQLTGVIGQITALTNLSGQVDYLTSTLNGMTNLNTKVDQLGTTLGKVATLTNLPAQVSAVSDAVNRMANLTNLASRVDQIVALTNVSSQVSYLTTTLNGMTNLNTKVDQLGTTLGKLASLTNLTPQVDQLTASMGQITALTSMPAQISYLTSTLNGMTNLGPKVDSITNAVRQLSSLTNFANQVGELTNSIDRLIALTNMTATLNELASLTNLGVKVDTLMADFAKVNWTNIGSVATSNSVNAISSVLTGLQFSVTNVAMATSNLLVQMETKIGTEADPAGSDTVFGRLYAIEENLGTVGDSASQASQKARSARTEAANAVAAISDIQRSVAEGQIPKIMEDLAELRKALSAAATEAVAVRDSMGTDKLVKALSEALDKIDKAAKERGMAPPSKLSAEELAPGGLTDQQTVAKLMDKIAEAKAMMEAIRLLMDEAVNKPVVVDWWENK